jgi:hypothetical protein
MTSAVQLYEALATAPDDKTRAKLIAEAFERLEERYPHLPNLVTHVHLRETELRLLGEIEQVRKEIELVRAELKLEIAHVKTDLVKWVVPLMLAQIAVIAALVKLL